MPNILFLSDNTLFADDLCSQIQQYLPEYKIFTHDDEKTIFDIALLDGESFLLNFRTKHPKIPALILEPSESNKYNENKLDIFVFKPIILSQLLTQIQSGINLFENSVDGFLSFGQYELHPVDKEIIDTKTNVSVKLTEREVSIIQYLYKSHGKPVSKNNLLQHVWEYNADVSTHTIETHIYRLRKKIEHILPDADIICAENGGYRLDY